MAHPTLEEVMNFRLSSTADVDAFMRIVETMFGPETNSEILKQRASAEALRLSALQHSLLNDQLL